MTASRLRRKLDGNKPIRRIHVRCEMHPTFRFRLIAWYSIAFTQFLAERGRLKGSLHVMELLTACLKSRDDCGDDSGGVRPSSGAAILKTRRVSNFPTSQTCSRCCARGRAHSGISPFTQALSSRTDRSAFALLLAFFVGILPFAADAAEKAEGIQPKEATQQPPAIESGNLMLASAEGVSVFTRDGAMPFGHFVTTLKDGKPGPVEWDDMVYDGWRLDSGNYLCSSHRYVRELSPDGKLVWEFRLSAPNELKTCVPLPNGDVMTVDAERMELVQVTDQGRREVKRIPVPTRKEAPIHTRYNLLRRTPAGTFLLALRHEKAFIEVDESGAELWRHSVPDLPVVAERLANGNTLMSWSGGVIEAAPDHHVVWELKSSDIADFPVIIFGGFHRFANGNTLAANSDWHYKKPGQNSVQVFEVTPDKRVVWKLTTDSFANRKPGSLEPSTGLVEHRIIGLQWLGAEPHSAQTQSASEDDKHFFETKVQPVLVERCYECHSHAKKIKSGLALDSRSGWEKGGEGGPAVVPGAPEKSRLITAVEYGDKDLQMPPKKKLSDTEIAVLVEWVKRGAFDPRTLTTGSASKAVAANKDWESVYQDRLGWWSLQPVSKPRPPEVKNKSWPRNKIDNFILAGLEAKGLKPAVEAERRTIARRLSFALTGLPLAAEDAERFVASKSPRAYDDLVQSLLNSPHFGERWARHWMDVVHYSDTHGYEWDTPAKNAWMYRDYLVRAFNADVPFRQLVLEQIAGDLIRPRVDPRTGLNESILGPMAMRLGERRHGDNADAEGVTQEATGNIIDTVSKGFLATTVACAQCHDHKLDAVAQRDYYGLAGILMSTRWGVRVADTRDPNVAVIKELKAIKREIRRELTKQWRETQISMAAKISAMTADDAAKSSDSKAANKTKSSSKSGFPDTILALWRHLDEAATNNASREAAWNTLAGEFRQQRAVRIAANRTNLHLLADFTRKELPADWQIDGFGMKHGLVSDGEIVIAGEGDAAITQLLPEGRWSHVWSQRLAGAMRSRQFDPEPPVTFSVGYEGGQQSAQSVIVDNCFHSERMKFLDQRTPGWLTLTAGNFPALAGGVDHSPRRVYLELVTKSLNNYFPPRTAYGGVKESDLVDERSWFGVTKIYQHAEGKSPADELTRFVPLFANRSAPRTKDELATRLTELVRAAVERWSHGTCDSEDVRLINEALTAKWLPNESKATPTIAKLVASYRDTEKRLQPDLVIGSVADWNEGRDERIGVRGSYTDLGETVPRGNIRFLGGAATRAMPQSSGRLEFARNIASDKNPLTARVFVNRVWHHLYGAGLVRTVDDFGHLGEKPSNPELLDWLTHRFIEDGWSVKKLVTLMVTSASWRQSSIAGEASLTADPENRLFHHLPMRRLEAEEIRDSMLFVSRRLDASMFGPPIDPNRTAEDAAKRLVSGPIDGNGRRSIYLKMTLMEPPKFLALFNQPIPKLTVGRRDATNVPDQALALLNDPFVVAMAKHWSGIVLKDDARSAEQRIRHMFAAAFARPPKPDETERFVKLVQRSAELRGVGTGTLLSCQPVWQDVAHAIFNLKEFIYVQ